jgi:hypothetical protein
VYSDVDKKGGAIVEFTTARDQDAAIAKFDNTQWKNPRSYIAETSVITIRKPPKADSPEEEKDGACVCGCVGGWVGGRVGV